MAGVKDELHVAKLDEFLGPDMIGMSHNTAAHAIVERAEPVDLFDVGQLLLARCAGRAEGVVQLKLISIEEMNFSHRRFGEQVKDVRSSPTQSEDGHLAEQELGCGGSNPRAGGRHIRIVKDARLRLDNGQNRLVESRGTGAVDLCRG